jgi:hypothetical protein
MLKLDRVRDIISTFGLRTRRLLTITSGFEVPVAMPGHLFANHQHESFDHSELDQCYAVS